MPKVGKVRANFQEFPGEYELFYNQKEKFHIKGLPADFLRVMDKEFLPFGHDTEEKLKTSLFYSVQKYRELIKTYKKVILYKIEASAELSMNKARQGCYSGIKKGISKRIHHFDNGRVPDCTIGIEYEVAMQMNDGSVKYFRLNEDGSMGYEKRYDSKWTAMDWTEKREGFLLSVYDSMGKLLLGLSSFFSDNDEDVVNKIDSLKGNFKLLD